MTLAESPRKWQTFDVRLEIILSNRTGANGQITQAQDSLYQVVDALGVRATLLS
jgi:hypothetical protein